MFGLSYQPKLNTVVLRLQKQSSQRPYKRHTSEIALVIHTGGGDTEAKHAVRASV